MVLKERAGEGLLLHMFYIHEQNKSISYFCWFVSSRILIHNLETFTFPSTTRLHAIKRQEFYKSFLRRYGHIHVDISPVLGRGVCLMCNSGCVCVCVFCLYVTMYITFHGIIISPSITLLSVGN